MKLCMQYWFIRIVCLSNSKIYPWWKEYMANEPEPVVKDNQDTWTWHPQSTAVRHPLFESHKYEHIPYCKQWDHLTHAFLIPDGCHGIKIPSETLLDNFRIVHIEKDRKRLCPITVMKGFLEDDRASDLAPHVLKAMPAKMLGCRSKLLGRF